MAATSINRNADIKCYCGSTTAAEYAWTKRCIACATVYDIRFPSEEYTYDDRYPTERGFFDASTGNPKVEALAYWLNASSINIAGKRVCEIGFGGGYTLSFLRTKGAEVYGIEVVDEAIQFAINHHGIEPKNLLRNNKLPPLLDQKIDLWLFIDSFEHLSNPPEFVKWLASNSSEQAKVLIVSPSADSASRKWLGKLWPHYVRDHYVHWSRQGIENLFNKYNFKITTAFHPIKIVNIVTMVQTLRNILGLRPNSALHRFLPDWSIRFNIGEFGLVLGRGAPKT